MERLEFDPDPSGALADLAGEREDGEATRPVNAADPNVREVPMAIRLDHTIVPAKDKNASAAFFAEIFGLKVKPGSGYFAQVQVNESLTLDFADEPEAWRGPGFDPRSGRSQHYAFHVSEPEFEAILGRIKDRGIPYGSGPDSHANGQINRRRGGRGFYFEDPYGHLLEVMTVPETGS